jgi:hypothetical protein
MEVRRLRRDEVDLYRATRMRALADSPDAFGESVADAESMPPSFWAETVERFATSPDQILFIACEGAEVRGSVSGRLMRPPVLTAEQAAVFSRALAGAVPAPADAAVLGSRWHEVALALASRTERDPRLVFDYLTGSGLGFADVARIMPFPPPGGFHRRPGGPRSGPPGNDPHGYGPEGHPPPSFMFPTCATVMIGGMWVAPEHRRRGPDGHGTGHASRAAGSLQRPGMTAACPGRGAPHSIRRR